MEKALLITVKLKSDRSDWQMQDLAEELEELTTTCGAEIIDTIICNIERPTPKYFIGSGKAEEIAAIAQQLEADTIIFSSDLSGTQQRNLEDIIAKKTIDRTQLILDIFARHAKSPVGKMQVELAQLQYLLPRLTGKGVILSRTGGGIGTSGPGETKLETDRRRIRSRIDKLGADLKGYEHHRKVAKKQRIESQTPAVALVGYTNAGKSTLLNALTEAGQVVANSLFTTLDPLSKSLVLGNGEHVVVSDTVGFLHGLPHHLIEAFKATLEEVRDADVLIHVIDASHSKVYAQYAAVMDVLKQLGAHEKPIITALNKIDLLTDQAWLGQLKNDFPLPVEISALLKTNLNQLQESIASQFRSRMVRVEVMVEHRRMDLVDLFYRQGKVEDIEYLQKGIRIQVSLPKTIYDKLLHNKEIEIVS